MLTHSYDVKAAAEWRKIGIAIMYGSSKNGSPLSIGNYCFGIGRRTHIQGMVGYMESRSSPEMLSIPVPITFEPME